MGQTIGLKLSNNARTIFLVGFADAVAVYERFQMVSLLKLARVTEEGVRFLSPHDGSPM